MILLISVALADPSYVAHEWGTFTAVAAADGTSTVWQPLTGPSDLPSFVYTLGHQGIRGQTGGNGKNVDATIRMETPVIYFYADAPLEVSAAVELRDGMITEWYPKAKRWAGPTLDWGRLRVEAPAAGLPNDGTDSHYYPARNVASDLIRVCDEVAGDEVERFLFYRGVGTFELGLSATVAPSGVHVAAREAPPWVVVFERRGDRVGYRVAGPGDVARPALDGELPALKRQLADLLVGQGLYTDEAAAMVDTWESDWFEEGLRVIYPMPRAETDDRLVLTLDPAPSELVRVLVGRVELFTPEERAAASVLLASKRSDRDILHELEAQRGRFVEPLLRQVGGERVERILAAGR